MESNEKDALEQIWEEYEEACSKNEPWASPHEGHSIIEEEYDELWDEIKKKPQHRSLMRIHNEAKQLAAMAMRMMVECKDAWDGKGNFCDKAQA